MCLCAAQNSEGGTAWICYDHQKRSSWLSVRLCVCVSGCLCAWTSPSNSTRKAILYRFICMSSLSLRASSFNLGASGFTFRASQHHRLKSFLEVSVAPKNSQIFSGSPSRWDVCSISKSAFCRYGPVGTSAMLAESRVLAISCASFEISGFRLTFGGGDP